MTAIVVGTVDVLVVAPGEPWQVLVLRRGEGTRCTGAWEVVHGKIEAGETPETAARRELREETGLDALRLYTVCVQPFYLHVQGAVHLAVVFCAFVDPVQPVVLGDEHASGEWLDLDAALARVAWPRERAALLEAHALLRDGHAGAVEDVLRVW